MSGSLACGLDPAALVASPVRPIDGTDYQSRLVFDTMSRKHVLDIVSNILRSRI